MTCSGNRDRARSAGNIIIALTVMERPKWAEGLEAKGVYFEGMVSNADQRVERHNLETVTSYGTRTSRKVPVVNTPPPTSQLKENVS